MKVDLKSLIALSAFTFMATSKASAFGSDFSIIQYLPSQPISTAPYAGTAYEIEIDGRIAEAKKKAIDRLELAFKHVRNESTKEVYRSVAFFLNGAKIDYSKPGQPIPECLEDQPIEKQNVAFHYYEYITLCKSVLRNPEYLIQVLIHESVHGALDTLDECRTTRVEVSIVGHAMDSFKPSKPPFTLRRTGYMGTCLPRIESAFRLPKD